MDISIGDSSTVSLPEVEGRRNDRRLSGIRCIHTHPNGDWRLSAVDINSMGRLKLDAIVAIGAIECSVTKISVALPIVNPRDDESAADVFGPFNFNDENLKDFTSLILERDKARKDMVFSNEDRAEKAIIVGLEFSERGSAGRRGEAAKSLDELEELAYTAGVIVVHKTLQKRPLKDPAFFIGRGKVEEIALLRQALDADVVIFDDELSGAQFRNIEELTGIKVIDRTTLILDIFAQHAKSREGKLQVELAQLRYRLPRLIGLGGQLSRLGGGIGTRGPGEKKLEMDRRHIRRRIKYLEDELQEISRRRGLIRDGRVRNTTPVAAIVGYTNAGKSTLMNILCNSDVLAEDKLFATLDPATRKLDLDDGRQVLLIDTVGFIRKLPHDLVEAFKSTLEEAVFADLLLHVVDASSDEADAQVAVVNDILKDLGAISKPVLTVFNKTDLLGDGAPMILASAGEKGVEVSALTGVGIKELKGRIAEMLVSDEADVSLIAPYDEGWIMPYLYEHGRITEKEYMEQGIKIKATLKKSRIKRIKDYLCKSQK